MEEIPGDIETFELVSKTVPPTKCKINKPKGYKEIINSQANLN